MRRPVRAISALTLATACAAAVTSRPAAAATPVTGSVAGPVVSVAQGSFTLTTRLSPTGRSRIEVGSATHLLEQVAASRADLRTGGCLTAMGRRTNAHALAASRIVLSQPLGGRCGDAFRGRAGRRGTRPPGTRPADGTRRAGTGRVPFAFAVGTISAVRKSAVTVRTATGPELVTLSASTRLAKTVAVTDSAIRTSLCAFVRGTSGDRGVTVRATDVSLSTPGPGGCFGPPRRA